MGASFIRKDIKMKKTLAAFSMICAIFLSGCMTDSQNQYSAFDAGKQIEVEFGRIVLARQIRIQGKETGTGVLVGGAAGAGIGNAIAHGNARGTGALIGLAAGIIGGAIAEHELQNQKGIEYTITKRNGKTITIVQTIAADDVPLRRGQRVIIQKSGHYQRVLPADDLPDEVKKPKDIKVVG
jgi:outer membrane lipoprotein SlyB